MTRSKLPRSRRSGSLTPGPGARRRIDAALRRLCAPSNARVIASVYSEDHDRLWRVAQVGYDQVRDGFALGQGVLLEKDRLASPA